MATSHIPVSEAGRNLPDILARARAGEDIIIEDGGAAPIRLMPISSPSHGRPISEVIARLRALEEERGEPLVMDDDFAEDMREIIANRMPRDTSAWD
jgi:antitoxin (DNA-binding transcriptional repressor) of toxin-antitoxin stability system